MKLVRAHFTEKQRPTPEEAPYHEFRRRKEKILKLVDVVPGINLDLLKASEQRGMGIVYRARNGGF